MMLIIQTAIVAQLALPIAPETINVQTVANGAREACGPDYQALCSGVKPGGGRIIACLKQNESRLSPACRAVLSSGASKS